MKIRCDACGGETEITVSGPTLLRHALPKGWRPRRIDGRTYTLCDVCGNLRQFVGGLSPWLQQRLSLPAHVEVEFPEYDKLPDEWVARVRRGEAHSGPRTKPEPSAETIMVDINKVIQAGGTEDPERVERAAEVENWRRSRQEAVAGAEGIQLTTDHREALSFLQELYVEGGASRRARDIAQLLTDRFEARGGRRYLYELFPGGPVLQGSRIAGVPAPADASDKSFGSVL